MKIVFMGTPEIAVPSLIRLSKEHEVAAVFCQPDKPVGRKHVLTAPPVKKAAAELGIPVYQPRKMRDGTVRGILEEINPDVCAVIAYGRLLPDDVLAVPKYGFINAHGSLLPKYRGAAPIQYALINGDSTTGVTIMKIGSDMDAGDIILQRETEILPEDDAYSMFDKLGKMSAEMFSEVLSDIEGSLASARPQDPGKATFAPPLTTEQSVFSFRDPAWEIFGKVRGMCMNPVARTTAFSKKLLVLRAGLSEQSGRPGEVLGLDPLTVACGEGAVVLLSVKPEGKSEMTGTAWASGHRLKKGMVIE
ncbi:MAG: methionyl-tRNA formyltransferase [Oscillospiraceae bacterium]